MPRVILVCIYEKVSSKNKKVYCFISFSVPRALSNCSLSKYEKDTNRTSPHRKKPITMQSSQ